MRVCVRAKADNGASSNVELFGEFSRTLRRTARLKREVAALYIAACVYVYIHSHSHFVSVHADHVRRTEAVSLRKAHKALLQRARRLFLDFAHFGYSVYSLYMCRVLRTGVRCRA